jgi:hypothetical protein
MFDIQATTKSKYYDHILNPEDVVIGGLFLSIFYIDKTGSTETQFLGLNRKVVADIAGT